MNSSNKANPILSQIPLIVIPGKYEKPKTVTLPYDFVELPQELPITEQDTKFDIQILEGLITNQQSLIDKIRSDYGEDSKRGDLYHQWKKETILKTAPGYLDGGIQLMSPTRKYTNDIHDDKHQEQQQKPDEQPDEEPDEQQDCNRNDRNIDKVTNDLDSVRIN
ncbi:unnamed protein product [[Candida] boidinii]|nr:hypothetical protein B5S33_g3262 [[Candida] boidinii]GME87400.1 unnamed protein product [[Candida] boidinii]